VSGSGAWPRRRPLVLLGAVAAAALLLDLSSLHGLEHGDSIVPVLVSLQRWTPFYWDQERFGMLVPLLAWPVRDPLANLLLQRGLLVLAGLGAVVLLARHVLAGRDWPLAGALATGSLLALAPGEWLFEYLGDQPYGLGLALALGGLALAEGGGGPSARRGAEGGARAWAEAWPRVPALRLAGALALVLLAHWVNAAAGLLLLPLALARAGADLLEGVRARDVRARLGLEAGLLAIGLAAGQAAIAAYPALTGKPLRLETGALAPGEWPRAWATLFENAWREAAIWGSVLVVAAAAGVLLLALPPLRRGLRPALLRAGVLLAAALAYALLAGSLRWVQANAFHWRYLAPSAVLVHLAATSLLAEPLARLPRLARPAGLAALALVPLGALLAGGAPSLAAVRADLDRVAGAHTEAILAARCTAIAGDYWTVWPAVWHALLVRRERGDPLPVYGVSHRSGPTLPAFLAVPPEQRRVCVAEGETAHAERWFRDYRLGPLDEVARAGGVRILVQRPAPAPRTPESPP
jgi:hypothetical protein